MDALWNDIKFGLRTLLRSPALTGAALLALALGMGANTAMFSIVNGVLIEPLPYPEPDELMMVWEKNVPRGFPRFSVSPPNFADWKQQARSFEHLTAMNIGTLNLTGGSEPEVVPSALVSGDFFGAMGVQPAAGRFFGPAEDVKGKEKVVVLSHALWQRRFGADPRIVGQGVTLDGESYTVAGVAPPKFSFPNKRELWVPMALEPDPNERGAHYLIVLGRLREGVSREQAETEMVGIAGRLARQYPETNTSWSATLVPLHENAVQNVRQALLVLLAAVAAVLLIACLNVANLLLARLAAREREIAVRTALGAGRLRLVRQLLTESLLLAAGGAALGLLLAHWGTRAVLALNADQIPRADDIGIDWRVLGFTFGVTLVTGLLFGLFPALQAPGRDLHETLKEGGRATTGSRRSRLAREALVLAEVALALVLLVGAGLLLKGFSRLSSVDPGFDPEGLLTMEVTPPEFKYKTEEQQAAFYRALIERIEALPGVEAAATALPLPLSGGGFLLAFEVEGRPVPPRDQVPNANIRVVTPGFFEAMGIPLLRGRVFTGQDAMGSVDVAVVNRTMAEKIWPGEDPLGKRFTFDDSSEPDARWLTVVGVVGEVRHQALSEESGSEAYWPQLQRPMLGGTLVVRASRGDPADLAGPVRAAVQSLDPDLPVYQVQTMAEIVAGSLAPSRFNTVLFGIFAALALVLAAVGVYGVVSYSVTQRLHEIGVRMALGARRESVLAMVLRQGMSLAVLGIALGLLGAFFAARQLAGLLYGISPRDPETFALVALALAAVALLANWLPALRATRVDPQVALRRE